MQDLTKIRIDHYESDMFTVFFAGLDTATRNLEGMTQAYGDCFKPSAAILKLVKEGHLGRKTGRGFYDYSEK